MRRFAFYEKGEQLAIIEAADCWQALGILIQTYQLPFDYNPSFRQLPPPAKVIQMEAKREARRFANQP